MVRENPHKCANGYLAALYLFCADRDLWRVANKIAQGQQINFANYKRADLTIEQYTLVKVAQDIYTGSTHMNLQDLGDSFAVPDRIFEAILQALHIARLGYSYIGKKRYD
jgi:hypothetical protein